MAQLPIEVILTRQLVSYLSQAAFLVAPDGALIFYNEPAETILGLRYDETGEMPAEKWASVFQPSDAKGEALTPDQLPLMKTLTTRQPAHGRFFILGMDDGRREIEVTAIPLVGQNDLFHGAIALFWEPDSP